MDQLLQDTPTMYEGSKLSIQSELESFTLPQTDVSCLYTSNYLTFYPILNVQDPYNPIEFILQSDSNSYLDLSSSLLSVTARIKKADGKDCMSSDKCCAANLFFQLMIKNLEV